MHHLLGVLFIGPEEQEIEKKNRGDFFRKLAHVARVGRDQDLECRSCLTTLSSSTRKRAPLRLAEKKENRGPSCLFSRACRNRVQQLRGQFRVFSRFSLGSRKPLWNRIHAPSGFRLRKPSWSLFVKRFHRLNGWYLLLI